MKRFVAWMIALLFIPSCALAHVGEYEGKVVSAYDRPVVSYITGSIGNVYVEEGMWIETGDLILDVPVQKIYALTDASIEMVSAEPGDHVSGEVLSLEPKEKYRLLASASYAYDAELKSLIHPGETVYLSCVSDASHLGVGRVTQVDGEEFTIVTTHGTLYVGEAVNVFRDASRQQKSRIGRATVYRADSISMEAEGTVLSVYASQGDRVEKGELLMEYVADGGSASDAGNGVCSDLCGIVTGVHKSVGESVSAGDSVISVCTPENIAIRILVPEAEARNIAPNDRAKSVFALDGLERQYPVTVQSVSGISVLEEDGVYYEAILTFDEMPDFIRLGLSASVYF